MKLYHAPGACSFGIHVLLEEIGKSYQIENGQFSRRGAVQAALSRDQPTVEGADA